MEKALALIYSYRFAGLFYSPTTALLLLVSLRCHVCENDKGVQSIQHTPVYSGASLFVELDMLLPSLSVPSQPQLYHCKLID